MRATAPATLRAIDMSVDTPAIVELIAATSRHDKVPYFPTVASLANDWRPLPNFNPERDLQGLELDGRLVGLARHSWRERPSVVNHRLEVLTDAEHRRQGHGTRLLTWAEERARSSAAQGTGGPTSKPHQLGAVGPDNVEAAIQRVTHQRLES